MQHKKDFDWFINTVLRGHSSYCSNASIVNKNDMFCDEKVGGGVLFYVAGYCFH
jgi:hypothetical protein